MRLGATKRARVMVTRAMVMATQVAVEEEGEGKGRKSDGNGDKEGNGNGDAKLLSSHGAQDITSLVSFLSLQKINNIFKLEVPFVLPSLVAPLSWQVDGIVGQTNILSDPSLHMDHGDAIY